jgi:hypothetical protein
VFDGNDYMPLTLTIETDAAIMDHLASVLSEAFPAAEISWEGPLQESVRPEDLIHGAFVGMQAVCTITGGAPAAVEMLRSLIAFVKSSHQTEPRLRHTVLRYRETGPGNQSIELDLTTESEDVALAAVKSILKNRRDG